MEATLTIGKVAKEAGVNIQTIRFYERKELLSPDGHRESGYRLYAPDAINRVRFIKNAQELGFSLKEVSGLLRLRISRRVHCASVKKKAGSKLRDVQEKIAGLQALERVLRGLINTCQSQGTTNSCPILKSLEVNRKSNVSKGVKKR
ncbi:MAG: heavy metal-responsive transcriptional regulator [Elusimicrobia bacterium]|nr:heavy metal-responsive transcriptional regulator [Elusimicrobiota bacterium]